MDIREFALLSAIAAIIATHWAYGMKSENAGNTQWNHLWKDKELMF